MASINRYSLFLLRERKNLLRLSLNENNNQIAFKYMNNNPNGSIDNIAGIYSKNYRTLLLIFEKLENFVFDCIFGIHLKQCATCRRR